MEEMVFYVISSRKVLVITTKSLLVLSCLSWTLEDSREVENSNCNMSYNVIFSNISNNPRTIQPSRSNTLELYVKIHEYTGEL